jgi:DNA-binding transcriptional MerR regulator
MLRIGELSRRTGVSPELLRAWERRYGLLRPRRTEGGFRLYSSDDEARILRMQAHLAAGLSAAEAARLAATEPEPVAGRSREEELLDALLALDEARAQSVLDTLFAELTPEAAIGGTVLPALRRIGELWERGEASIAQEHFASNLVRGRLFGLARRWDQGVGPRALLACAPGELHDLPLIAFGVALRARGWRILYLGADTPLETVAAAAGTLHPDLVVLSSTIERDVPGEALAPLAAAGRLALGGKWRDFAALDVERLEGDAVEAAAALTPY